MKSTLITGIALIVIGAAVLGYDHYTYTTTEKILQIGPITATALIAAVGDRTCFKNGRQFAAWLGLVPRWVSPASTSTAPRHRPKPCRSTHQVREATG